MLNNNVKRSMLIVCFTINDVRLNTDNEAFVKNITKLDGWYEPFVINWDGTSELEKQLTEHVTTIDVIVLLNCDSLEVYHDTALIRLVLKFHRCGKRLVSIGLGFSLFANAGLLNGRTISTSKKFIDELPSKYPFLKFSTDILYSEEDGIYCFSSSVAAVQLWTNLACKDLNGLVVSDFTRVVKGLNTIPSDYSKVRGDSLKSCGYRLEKTLIWAEDNLQEISNLDMLAEKTFMSRRNFDRQFKAIYNITPKEWLTEKRLLKARYYLETCDLCIEEIACAVGFGCAVNFRNNFRSHVGISPSEYRLKFNKALNE